MKNDLKPNQDMEAGRVRGMVKRWGALMQDRSPSCSVELDSTLGRLTGCGFGSRVLVWRLQVRVKGMTTGAQAIVQKSASPIPRTRCWMSGILASVSVVLGAVTSWESMAASLDSKYAVVGHANVLIASSALPDESGIVTDIGSTDGQRDDVASGGMTTGRLLYDNPKVEILVIAGDTSHPGKARSGKTKKSRAERGWAFPLEGGRYGTEIVETGADSPFCQEIRNYMNRAAPKWTTDGWSYNACASAILTAPFFSEPPWEELDPKAHTELIAKLLRYASEGHQLYFDNKPAGKFRRDEQYYRSKVKEFIDSGGRLQRMRAASFHFHRELGEAVEQSTNGKEREIVQLRYVIPDSAIAERRSLGGECNLPDWSGKVFVVTDDYHGPHPLESWAGMTSASLLRNDLGLVLIWNDASEIDVSGLQHPELNCRLVDPRNNNR